VQLLFLFWFNTGSPVVWSCCISIWLVYIGRLEPSSRQSSSRELLPQHISSVLAPRKKVANEFSFLARSSSHQLLRELLPQHISSVLAPGFLTATLVSLLKYLIDPQLFRFPVFFHSKCRLQYCRKVPFLYLLVSILLEPIALSVSASSPSTY